MVSLTVPLEPKLKEKLSMFSWVNWSDVGREEILKKDIFERYLKTKRVTDEDWRFCESIDWHPVDELPMKEEHIKELKRVLEEETPGRTYSSAEEFFDSLK